MTSCFNYCDRMKNLIKLQIMVATKKEQIYSLNKENFSFNKEKFMKDTFRVKALRI